MPLLPWGFRRELSSKLPLRSQGSKAISAARAMAEQSSKSLRGTRTTDLIFNGSGSRKPVNRVEISLTLTKVPNRIRIASIPNLSEEVKITRCYHRLFLEQATETYKKELK